MLRQSVPLCLALCAGCLPVVPINIYEDITTAPLGYGTVVTIDAKEYVGMWRTDKTIGAYERIAAHEVREYRGEVYCYTLRLSGSTAVTSPRLTVDLTIPANRVSHFKRTPYQGQ